MWVGVGHYTKISGLSRSGVYKQIREGKLKTRKDAKDRTQIFVKKDQQPNALELITQTNNKNEAVDKLINRLEEAHQREIASLKELLAIKEKKIQELETENRVLREKRGILGIFK